VLLAETTYSPHMAISNGVNASNLDMPFLVSRDFHKFILAVVSASCEGDHESGHERFQGLRPPKRAAAVRALLEILRNRVL